MRCRAPLTNTVFCEAPLATGSSTGFGYIVAYLGAEREVTVEVLLETVVERVLVLGVVFVCTRSQLVPLPLTDTMLTEMFSCPFEFGRDVLTIPSPLLLSMGRTVPGTDACTPCAAASVEKSYILVCGLFFSGIDFGGVYGDAGTGKGI